MRDASLTNKVYNYIIDQIKQGKWQTGDKIFTEQELCNELGTSRIVVREAIEKCVALGILSKRKGSGTFVESVDIASVINRIVPLIALQPMSILDVMTFRLRFEPGNVSEFIKHAEPKWIEEMAQCNQYMKENADNEAEFHRADRRFHRIIAMGTGNPIIISVNNMLEGILEEAHAKLLSANGPENALYYHDVILRAIQDKDMELASLLMKRHIQATLDSFQQNVVDEIKTEQIG